MNEVLDKVSNLTVIKRNGKKVDFDGSKIALAIKKGFDSFIIRDGDDEQRKYNESDIQVVYKEVIEQIDKKYGKEEKIKIEQIQDLIEDALKKKVMMMYMLHSLNIVKEELNLECYFLKKRNFINS